MKPVPEQKKDGFKTGANKLDQNAISNMNTDGISAKDISLKLKIKLEVVKSFLPKKKKTTTKKKED